MTISESDPISIVVNGEVRPVSQRSTLLDIVKMLGLKPDRIAIEKDRTIVRRPEWATTLVEPGSQLEIVQFVGGG
jgi:thiamine biosynthesis protein ThiS